MTQRIPWIDGLKGLASVLIFLHHFILAFYPAMYYGADTPSHLFGMDYKLAESPIIFFVGGHFLVCVFLLLSGIVLNFQSKKIDTVKDLLLSIIKRYLKLAIPLFIVSAIVFMMLRLNLFYNFQASEISKSPWLILFYDSIPSLKEVFTTSFYDVWFVGNDTFSTAFWMLYILFSGSLLTLITQFILNKTRLNKYLVYAVLLIYYVANKSLLVNFVFGMIIADSIMSYEVKQNQAISLIFLIFAAILGGYPFGLVPTNFYRYFLLLPSYFSNPNFIHTLGALLLVVGILFNEKLIRLLSFKSMRVLGNLSYAIYLVHIPILFSLSTFLLIVLYPLLLNYNLSVLTIFVITIPVLLFISFIAQELFSFIDGISKMIKSTNI